MRSAHAERSAALPGVAHPPIMPCGCPLVRKSYLNKVSQTRFNPTFRSKALPWFCMRWKSFRFPKDKLEDLVGSLSKISNRIIDPLDELISRTLG
jgi:hypothetical protein